MIQNSSPSDATSMKKVRYMRGDLIAREGQPGNDFYILISGKIAVYKKILKVAEIIEQGDICGELALLLGGLRQNSLIAMEDNTEVFVVTSNIDNILKDQQLTKKLLYSMADRLVRTTETLSMLNTDVFNG